MYGSRPALFQILVTLELTTLTCTRTVVSDSCVLHIISLPTDASDIKGLSSVSVHAARVSTIRARSDLI